MKLKMPDLAVPSPCVQVCRLDAQQVCTGCGRTIDEIVEWPAAGAARKHAIREGAAARLREMPTRPPA